ncbi:hypothetical protein Hanom_Chr14g01321651 [Helianthus anomalus]
MGFVPTPSRNGDGRRTVPPPPRPVLNVQILPFATNQLWWPPCQMSPFKKEKLTTNHHRRELQPPPQTDLKSNRKA